MSKDLVKNEAAYIARIEKAEKRIERSSKTFIDDCIFLGEELIEIQKNIGHGGWISFLNRNSEFRFATSRQASKYIKIAENKNYAHHFLMSETSVNGLVLGITKASEDQLQKGEELTQAEVEKSLAEKQARFEEAQAKKAKAEQDKKDGIIDGEFSEVLPSNELEKINIEPKAPKPEPEKSSDDLFHEEIVEIINDQEQINLDLRRENSRLEKIMGSDDKLALLMSENTRLTRELADMTDSSNRHMDNVAKLQRENNALHNQLKRLRNESKVIVK